ncbi:MAG TPA: hypothetical protein VFQ12_07610 [Thermoleophilaceae bacterium]|nr:hypothetical protein [Thermoleophilaceae bacterium]
MRATIDIWTGGLGLLAGFCAVAAWLAIAGQPADAPPPSASIRLGALATGELAISPLEKPVLAAADLRPGQAGEEGTVTIRNQTPRALEVSLRTSAVTRELDRSAWIDVAERGRSIVREPLGGTRSWSPAAVRLAPGEKRTLSARVWIPERAEDGWQAARGDAMLEFRGKVVPGR